MSPYCARSENTLGAALMSLNRRAEAEQHLVSSYKSLIDKASGAPVNVIQTAKERLNSFYRHINQPEKIKP